MSQAIENPVQQTDETADAAVSEEVVIEEDSLVEEVSIDGMCGVY